MESSSNISYAVSFTAGFLIFLSPCVLPLIPSYISYLTGVSFKGLSGEATVKDKRNIRILTMIHSLMFIIGFSIVFISLGTSVTFLGKLFFEFQVVLKKLGALLIIFFGLMIDGY